MFACDVEVKIVMILTNDFSKVLLYLIISDTKTRNQQIRVNYSFEQTVIVRIDVLDYDYLLITSNLQ